MKTTAELWLTPTAMHFTFWVPDHGDRLTIWAGKDTSPRSINTSDFSTSFFFTNVTKPASSVVSFTIPDIYYGDFYIRIQDNLGNWIKRDFNVEKEQRRESKGALIALNETIHDASGEIDPGASFALMSRTDTEYSQSTATLSQAGKVVGWAIGRAFRSAYYTSPDTGSQILYPFGGILFANFVWMGDPPASPESYTFTLNPNTRSGTGSKIVQTITMSSTEAIAPASWFTLPDYPIEFNFLPGESLE